MRPPKLMITNNTQYDGGAASGFTVPDLLSGGRLVLTPVLFALAWQGRAKAFLVCLAIALLSDALDGWLARRLGGGGLGLGTRLDSWADIALCLSVPVGVWWLWPDLVRREAIFVGAVVVCYAVPALFAWLKYGRLPSYHTWVAKVAGVLMGSGGLVLLTGGPAWGFHLAVLVVVIEALEEVAITAILPRWRSNVPSFWHALLITRRERVM